MEAIRLRKLISTIFLDDQFHVLNKLHDKFSHAFISGPFYKPCMHDVKSTCNNNKKRVISNAKTK